MNRLLLVVPILLFLASPVRADEDLVSNLASTDRASMVMSTAGSSAAQAFETGAAAAPLRSITVRLRHFSGASSTARIRLWNGSSSTPSTIVEDLGTISNIVSPASAEFTIDSTAQPVLAANTRYWVTVTNESGDFDWFNTNDTAVAGDGSIPSVRATSPSGNVSSWSAAGAGSGDRQIMAVTVFAPQTYTASETGDSGTGSLREQIEKANAHPGPDEIELDFRLNGQTIVLTTGPLPIEDELIIDASSLADPPTISGNSDGDGMQEPGESRVFEIDPGVTATLKDLIIANGQAAGAGTGESAMGGAILNEGTLFLEDCAVVDSNAALGGGLANRPGANGTMSRVTFSDNSANSTGGAVYNQGTLDLEQCTLAENLSSGSGGAVANASGAVLASNHTTISLNQATTGGGGIVNEGSLSFNNTVVAENTAGNGLGPEIHHLGGNVSTTGVNFVGDVSNSTLVASSALLTGDPILGPLEDNGGPVETMLPLFMSPTIDPSGGSVTSPFANDQRGVPRVVGPYADIGSVENQGSEGGIGGGGSGGSGDGGSGGSGGSGATGANGSNGSNGIGGVPGYGEMPPMIISRPTIKTKRPRARIRGRTIGASNLKIKILRERGQQKYKGTPAKFRLRLNEFSRRRQIVRIIATGYNGVVMKKRIRVKKL